MSEKSESLSFGGDERPAGSVVGNNRRQFLKLTGVSGAVGLSSFSGCLSTITGSPPTINMLSWNSYTQVKDEVEEALDVELDITKSASSAKMFSSWNAGQNEDYDICVPNNNYVPKFLDADLLAPLPTDTVSNYSDMFPKFQEFAETQLTRDGTTYGLPTRFGWYGYTYDSRDLSPDHEHSYGVLFDDDHTDVDMSGSVMMFDNHFKAIAAAAMYLGFEDSLGGDKYELTDEQLEEAKQLLIDQKSSMLEGYTTKDATLIRAMEQGDAVAANSGRYLAVEMKLDGTDWISVASPKEGELSWYEAAVVSNASDNKEMAWKVVNQYIQPETASIFSEAAGFPSTNPKFADHLSGQSKELLSLEPSRLDGMVPYKPVVDEQKWIDAWEVVKTS